MLFCFILYFVIFLFLSKKKKVLSHNICYKCLHISYTKCGNHHETEVVFVFNIKSFCYLISISIFLFSNTWEILVLKYGITQFTYEVNIGVYQKYFSFFFFFLTHCIFEACVFLYIFYYIF